MDEHTQQILNRMLFIINDYKESKIGLRYLVDGLEGSLSALEERMPNSFYNKWYAHWEELELILATNSEEQNKDYIVNQLKELESILNQIMSHTHSPRKGE